MPFGRKLKPNLPAILNVENPGYLTFEGDAQRDRPMHEKYYVMRD